MENAAPLVDQIKNTFGFSDQLTDYLSGNAENIKEVIGSLSPGDMQRIIFHSLGPGWWMLFAALVMQFISFGIASAAAKPSGQPHAPAKPVRNETKEKRRKIPCDGPAVIVETGKLKGTRIRLNIGTRLSVGRDPGQCTLVLEEQGIEPLHCVISFDPAGNEYHIRDYSRKGILYEGTLLKTKTVNLLPGDTRIGLGSEANVLYLELAKPDMVTYSTGYQEDNEGTS